MHFSGHDYIEPDAQIEPRSHRGWDLTRRKFALLLSGQVGEPVRLSRELGLGFCREDLRIYRPARATPVQLVTDEDRPLAVVALRLMVHPEHSDYGPPGIALRVFERELLQRAEEVRHYLESGLFGPGSPVGVRVLPSFWSWRRAWSPGLVAVGRMRDYPALFEGA